MNLRNIIQNNTVNFHKYRKGILYYRVTVNHLATLNNESGIYEFHVPIDDCGDADFPATDKAIMFMRYIKKSIDDRTFVKVG